MRLVFLSLHVMPSFGKQPRFLRGISNRVYLTNLWLGRSCSAVFSVPAHCSTQINGWLSGTVSEFDLQDKWMIDENPVYRRRSLEVVPERVLMRIVGPSQQVARWNGIVFYEGGCCRAPSSYRGQTTHTI